MKGELQIIVTDARGNRYEYDTPNIITYGAARVAAHALVGDTDFYAAKIAVGTGSTPPTRDDTALVAQIYEENLPSPSFPYVGQVQVGVVLGNNHVTDGQELREVGLFTSTNILIARQIHAPIMKDTMFQVEYRWRIVFT